MAENTPKLSVDEIVNFLIPILDVRTCDQISLTKFARDHTKIIEKISQTGRPVLLRVNEQALLLCSAEIYFELENRRQRVLARLTVEEVLRASNQAGKIDVRDSRIVEMQSLQDKANWLEAEIHDSSWRLEQDLKEVEKKKKELADARVRVTSLTAELKKSETST